MSLITKPSFTHFKLVDTVAKSSFSGLIAEAASGIQIGPRLLYEPRYLLKGPGSNPLSWGYYTCGLVFMLSALAYAPLRPLSSWETRRYLSKRALRGRPSALSAFSNSGVPAITANESTNQRPSDSSPGCGLAAAASDDAQDTSEAFIRRCSVCLLVTCK